MERDPQRHHFESPLTVPMAMNPDVTGVYMKPVYHEFGGLVGNLEDYQFEVEASDGQEKRSGQACLGDVKLDVCRFLCFATNACMRMKVHDDMERRAFRKEAPTTEGWYLRRLWW